MLRIEVKNADKLQARIDELVAEITMLCGEAIAKSVVGILTAAIERELALSVRVEALESVNALLRQSASVAIKEGWRAAGRCDEMPGSLLVLSLSNVIQHMQEG